MSIWGFQIQSAKGGKNPALRTLYYRLLRLLTLVIQPLFVFDGPNKPPFKRNAQVRPQGPFVTDYLIKQLLQLFGFPFHLAPGEAEAECALLQQKGIVDAVFSEDVDTLMFGCTFMLRKWTSEGTRGSKSPTHVNSYRMTDLEKSGLDCDGMILVALMSGGDYIPAGVPRCGIQIACEAARAGFGRDLCRLSENDVVGFREWRDRLNYELRTNESKYFRVKHGTLQISESFPNIAVLKYYTHPAVSSSDELLRLTSDLSWDCEINVCGLRKFVAEMFDWQNLSGAHKLLRGLAPAMLSQNCTKRSAICTIDDAQKRELEDLKSIQAICGARKNFSTDGLPELRIIYTPARIVGLDLGAEEEDNIVTRNLIDIVAEAEIEELAQSPHQLTQCAAQKYDPTQPDKMWISESYVKLKVPHMVKTWEQKTRKPTISVSKNAESRVKRKQTLIESFTKTSKINVGMISKSKKSSPSPSKILYANSNVLANPPETQAIEVEKHESRFSTNANEKGRSKPRMTKVSQLKTQSKINPWTLSKLQSDTSNLELPVGTRYSALDIYETPKRGQVDIGVTKSNTELLTSPPPSSTSRKNCSPLSSSFLEGFDVTNFGQSTSDRGNEIKSVDLERFVTRKINRKLSFDGDVNASSASSSDSLPSPSILMSPSASLKFSRDDTHYDIPLKALSSPTKEVEKKRTLIASRKSVNGAWRSAEPWEAADKNAKVMYQGVEVIDLTAS